MHGGISRLLSPRGTRPNSFSVNFHPLPNSDEPFFSHRAHNEGFVLVLFVHLWHLFLTAPSPADSMQRMQIHALLFPRPLPWMNATLNEDTLAHIYRGGGGGGGWSMETRTYYNQWICMPSLTCSHSKHRTLTVLKRADRNMWCHRLFYLRGLFTQTDGSQTRHLRLEVVGYWCTFKKKIKFYNSSQCHMCRERKTVCCCTLVLA